MMKTKTKKDFDQLLKQLQGWVNKVPLVILGSGASVPFGLPSMYALGEYIKSSAPFPNPEDQEQFDEFVTLFDKEKDLEKALSELSLRENVLEQIVKSTWQLVNKLDIEAYEHLICDEVDFPLRDLMEYFLNTAARKASIVTTNYDRLAEYAASFAKAIICTGYAQNYVGHFSNSIHSNNLAAIKGYNGQVNIWKVHGSLDWFKTKEENNIQLPLRHIIPNGFTPLIVTPGLKKYSETHNEPYRTIFTQADAGIESADGFLCIGYGFNDNHVQPKLLDQIKSHKPIVVIAKELTPKTKQSIIDRKCKNYILIEEANFTDTRIYSSHYDDILLPGMSYWKLESFLKLIIT